MPFAGAHIATLIVVYAWHFLRVFADACKFILHILRFSTSDYVAFLTFISSDPRWAPTSARSPSFFPSRVYSTFVPRTRFSSSPRRHSWLLDRAAPRESASGEITNREESSPYHLWRGNQPAGNASGRDRGPICPIAIKSGYIAGPCLRKRRERLVLCF